MLLKSNKFPIKSLIFLLWLNIAKSKVNNYLGHKQFVVEHINNDVYEHMQELQVLEDKLDFWLLSRNKSVVLVPDSMDRVFEQRMYNIGAPYEIVQQRDTQDNDYDSDEDDEDYDESLSAESATHFGARRSRAAVPGSGFFTNFQNYDQIVHYLKRLALAYPRYARVDTRGLSSEGRKIVSISISPNRAARKLIFIQGGAHAREWISISTVTYLAAKLLANINYYQNYMRDTEIVIVPVANPDGYLFSRAFQRLWRKNRRRIAVNSGCRGVDLNRNFGYYWNYVGASNHVCSEVYAGQTAFSEPETNWVQQYLTYNRHRTKVVLDFHSYGAYLLYPWGFTKTQAPTANYLRTVAGRVSQAIYKYRGTRYTIGSSAEVLYEAAGGLDDYAYGVLGVPLSYTFELPGNRFDPSPADIIPTGEETFNGFLVFLDIVSRS